MHLKGARSVVGGKSGYSMLCAIFFNQVSLRLLMAAAAAHCSAAPTSPIARSATDRVIQSKLDYNYPHLKFHIISRHLLDFAPRSWLRYKNEFLVSKADQGSLGLFPSIKKSMDVISDSVALFSSDKVIEICVNAYIYISIKITYLAIPMKGEIVYY